MKSKTLTNHFLLKVVVTLFLSICLTFCLHLSVQAETREWTFDDASDYTVSNPAAVEVMGGVAQTISNFEGFGWNYRKALTIDNPNSQLDEYQIEVKLDSSHSNFWAHVASDGSDIRFTDSDGVTFIDFYIYHFDYAQQEAGIWVKVPLISTPTHTIFFYYGNQSATNASDIVETFSYSEPRTVGYVVSNRIATSGNLKVLSLADGNTIDVGSTSYSLDEREMTQVSNPNLTQSTPISATDLFHADGSADGTDMVSPVSWAATEFTYYSMRNTNIFHLLSPWGTANAVIYNGGSQVWSGTVDTSGTVANADITNNRVVRVSSDIPILVQHLSTGNQDSGVYYPASEEYLYGIASNYLQLGSGPDGAQVNWIKSDGTTGSRSLGSNQGYSQGGGGSQASGPAYRVKSDSYPIGVNQLADSDGTELSTFLPKKEMGTRFGANNVVQYIAIAAPYPNTTCMVYDSDGGVVATQTGGGRTDVNKIYFGNTSGYNWEDAGWECECDKPVYAYYEKEDGGSGEPSDETNLMSYPQMRQFTYPTPIVESVDAEESLFTSASPWVSPTAENAQSFSSISDFLETAQKSGGEIYYQLSNDGGSSWLYWNGISWDAVGPDDYTTADSIQENITNFPAGEGIFLFKAFLVSDGSVQIKLENIQITYLVDLQVTGIDPSFGYSDTPTGVTVTGESFKEEAEVFIGGFVCEVTTVSDDTIGAIVPQGMAPGLYGLMVKNPDGVIATLSDAFLVIDPLDPPDDTLQVTDINPTFGYVDAPTMVVVSGENFQEGATVIVGGFLCEVSSVSTTAIGATVPQGMAPGLHGVSVKNPDGVIATLPDAFLVIDVTNPPNPDLPPLIEGLYPSTITNGWDTPIVILGENFIEKPEVVIGGKVLSEVDYVSAYTLKVTVPADMPAGSYDVMVINPNGRSHLLENGLVVEEPEPPIVLYLLPDSTRDDVSIDVGIIGFNFEEESKVTLGVIELTEVNYLSSTTLMVTVPAGTPAGVYYMVVTNPDGRSGSLKNGFTVISTQPVGPEDVDLTVSPDVLLGSRWLPLLNIVLIKCEDGLTFTSSSLATFDSNDIRIWAQGVWDDQTLVVFLSVNADPQEEVVSITISDGDLKGEIVTVIDKDALTISLLPLILEEKSYN